MLYSPVVDDVLFTAPLLVAVQNEVAVTPKELPMGGGVHCDSVSALYTPDLQPKRKRTRGVSHAEPTEDRGFAVPASYRPQTLRKFTLADRKSVYLDLAGAVVHHAVLGSHGLVSVQGGGIEGHLLHLRNLANCVGLGGTCGFILVLPV